MKPQQVQIKPPKEASSIICHALRGIAAEIAKLPKEAIANKGA